jgi:lysozyme family protein
MSYSFDKAFNATILVEGGYSNNPYDSGGETMYGITVAVARAHGYTGPMRSLSLDEAKRIYKKSYWDIIKLDDVAAISERIAMKMFDIGVNMGTTYAVRFLQSGLNIFNRRGKDYPDIIVDDKIGVNTLGALKAFIKLRKLNGEIVLLKDLNVQQGMRYREISKDNGKNEEFMFGWYLNRIDIPGLG